MKPKAKAMKPYEAWAVVNINFEPRTPYFMEVFFNKLDADGELITRGSEYVKVIKVLISSV